LLRRLFYCDGVQVYNCEYARRSLFPEFLIFLQPDPLSQRA
jgi:hypothetical protein